MEYLAIAIALVATVALRELVFLPLGYKAYSGIGDYHEFSFIRWFVLGGILCAILLPSSVTFIGIVLIAILFRYACEETREVAEQGSNRIGALDVDWLLLIILSGLRLIVEKGL